MLRLKWVVGSGYNEVGRRDCFNRWCYL